MTVLVEKNVECRTRDGVVLRADVYRPAGDGRYPVLVLRTPYNKELFQFTHLTLDPVRAAAAGFAVVIQDTRGRWASGGSEFVPYGDEFEDGYDAVEWAAALPFSNGRVGVYGISYMGGAAWQAAVAAPPSLGAVAAAEAPNDQFVNLMWRGGAFLWGTHLLWALATLGPSELLRARGLGPDALRSFVDLVDRIDEYDELARFLPPAKLPAAAPDDPFFPYFYEAMRHSTRDAFHADRSTTDRHGSVRAPALIIAGWYDLLLASDLAHFGAMRRDAATEEARDETRLVIGPWTHGLFWSVAGDVDFGLRANGALLDLKEDLTALHLRWFNRWLRDGRALDQPRVKLFVQRLNRWRDEDDWPLARARPTPWYLGAGGTLGPEPPAAAEEPDDYVYDPSDPCPTRGGTLLLPRTHPAGPVDQSPLLDRRDVLVYTSEPLERDLEVTGPVAAVLYAATSARDTDWVVKLCDVRPDGRTLNVCDGILRASYRDRAWDSPRPVEPGAVERYEVDLWATSIVFRAGHRLRVLVTSSDFPRYDRNPNTGALGVEASTTEAARQRVFHDASRASHVLLPIVSV
jgi:putative CocE/NonD family hydrolase